MPLTALYSFLCFLFLLSGQPASAAENVQIEQLQTTQPPMILGLIPSSVTLDSSATTSFTDALAGNYCHCISADDELNQPELAGELATSAQHAVQSAAAEESARIAAASPAGSTAPEVKFSNIPMHLLDTAKPVDRVAALVSSNEGKPTSIDWNDNGKGVSVGIFQANQRVGQLPDLLYQLSTTEGGHEEIAATMGESFAEKISTEPEAVRKMRFSPKNALGKGLQKLVHSALFQKLQVAILRQKVARAAEVAADYGITSTAGVAVCADLTNQWGEGGAHKFLRAADTMRSEGGKVKAIVNAVCDYSPYDSRYRSDLEKLDANALSFEEQFQVSPEHLMMPGASPTIIVESQPTVVTR